MNRQNRQSVNHTLQHGNYQTSPETIEKNGPEFACANVMNQFIEAEVEQQ